MTNESPDLLALFLEHRERGQLLLAAFDAMPAGARRRATLLSYYCPGKRSCELLTVWQSPAGRWMWVRSYKLSPEVNLAVSTEAGRRKNTVDGDRRWPGFVLPLSEVWPEVGYSLNCDHHRQTLPARLLLADLETATPGRPLRRVVPVVPGEADESG